MFGVVPSTATIRCYGEVASEETLTDHSFVCSCCERRSRWPECRIGCSLVCSLPRTILRSALTRQKRECGPRAHPRSTVARRCNSDDRSIDQPRDISTGRAQRDLALVRGKHRHPQQAEPQRSSTRRSLLALLTQIIIIVFEAFSSGDKMKSRCSGTPSMTLVSQSRQNPLPHP